MKKIVFWLIIAATVLATLCYTAVTKLSAAGRRAKEEQKKSSRENSRIMKEARAALIQ